MDVPKVKRGDNHQIADIRQICDLSKVVNSYLLNAFPQLRVLASGEARYSASVLL